MGLPSRHLLAAAALAAAAVYPVFYGTAYGVISWRPGSVTEAFSSEEVVSIVAAANASMMHRRIIPYGTGWSWNTAIAGDGDNYVLLKGALATEIDINIAAQTATIGAGVKIFDVYMALQGTGLEVEAHGACLTADESQSIGGLLATNVHHSAMKSFFDVAAWVEVVTARDGLVRTFPGETLFRLTVGGKGRTGVIVRAMLNLSPRSTYQGASTPQPSNWSFAAFLGDYPAIHDGYAPGEYITGGILFGQFGYPSYFASGKTPEPMPNASMLPPDFGVLVPTQEKIALFFDGILDRLLTPDMYDWVYIMLMFGRLNGPQPSWGEYRDLDVVCSSSGITNLKHFEIEFFVPVGTMGAVGALIDRMFAEGRFPYIAGNGFWSLRYVYGCESLTAPSGVMADGSVTDVIAINIDCYQKSMWGQFKEELDGMLAELGAAFPQQIRHHPGKYNPPLSPDPESTEVKHLLESLDPRGLFARETYDGSSVSPGWVNINTYARLSAVERGVTAVSDYVAAKLSMAAAKLGWISSFVGDGE